jgi:hypothetical protein
MNRYKYINIKNKIKRLKMDICDNVLNDYT